jgi:hypothetical protein
MDMLKEQIFAPLPIPFSASFVTHGIKWPRRPRYAVFGKFRNEFEGQLRCSFGFRRYDQLRAKLQDELMHLLAIPEFDQLAIGDTDAHPFPGG